MNVPLTFSFPFSLHTFTSASFCATPRKSETGRRVWTNSESEVRMEGPEAMEESWSLLGEFSDLLPRQLKVGPKMWVSILYKDLGRTIIKCCISRICKIDWHCYIKSKLISTHTFHSSMCYQVWVFLGLVIPMLAIIGIMRTGRDKSFILENVMR